MIKAKESPVNFNDIPVDCLRKILSWLPPIERLDANLINKNCYSAESNVGYWTNKAHKNWGYLAKDQPQDAKNLRNFTLFSDHNSLDVGGTINDFINEWQVYEEDSYYETLIGTAGALFDELTSHHNLKPVWFILAHLKRYDIESPLHEGDTLLSYMAILGQVELVKLLLDKGANPNGNAEYNTALNVVLREYFSLRAGRQNLTKQERLARRLDYLTIAGLLLNHPNINLLGIDLGVIIEFPHEWNYESKETFLSFCLKKLKIDNNEALKTYLLDKDSIPEEIDMLRQLFEKDQGVTNNILEDWQIDSDLLLHQRFDKRPRIS